jgi:hypothetical protein
VARALAENAQARLSTVNLRAEALRGVVARETRAAEEADARRAAAAQVVVAARAETRQARAELDATERQLRDRADEFRVAAEPMVAARCAALATAEARVEEARAALALGEAERAAALAAALPPMVAAARETAATAEARLRTAEAAEAAAREALGNAIADEYARRHVTIATRPGPAWERGEAALCVEVANGGALAVRAVAVDLALRGRGLAVGGVPMSEALGAYGHRGVLEPFTKNPARELVTGLPPHGRWRTQAGECPVLNLEALAAGGGARAPAMAALGGASRRAADWRFTVQGVLLARPETLRRSSDDIWSYAVELHHVVFAAEIRRVEEAAAATPAEPSSSSAAAAAQGGQAPAALVAPVGAADAGEDDASDLDQATTVRVQRALNARNLGAGVPDGVAGPRMRDAIRAYQRSLGEPQTGELTGSQLRRLLGSGSG